MQNWLFDIRSRSFVLLTALFLILTAFVLSELTEGFDQAVILFISENVGNPTLDIFMQYVTESGDVFNMMVFAIIVLLIPKTRRVGITLLILIVIATLLTDISNVELIEIGLILNTLELTSLYRLAMTLLLYFVKVDMMPLILLVMLPDP